MVTFRNYDEKERIDRVWYQSSNIVFTECLDNPDSLKTLTVTFKNNRRTASVCNFYFCNYGTSKSSCDNKKPLPAVQF